MNKFKIHVIIIIITINILILSNLSFIFLFMNQYFLENNFIKRRLIITIKVDIITIFSTIDIFKNLF